MRKHGAWCDSCQVMVINGAACHETGCPKRHVNPATGKPYTAPCLGCGRKTPRQVNGKPWCGRCF